MDINEIYSRDEKMSKAEIATYIFLSLAVGYFAIHFVAYLISN